MPSRRWLFPLACVLLTITAFEFYRYSRIPLENRDSVGDLFVYPALFMIVLSVIIGTATRCIVLALKSKSVSFAKRSLATFLGYCSLIVLPLIFLGTAKAMSQFMDREAPAACNYHQIPVRMENLNFTIPGLPFVSLSTGTGNEKSEIDQIQKFNIFFHGKKDFRRYCEEYKNGTLPIAATMLSINFQNIAREKKNRRYIAYCEEAGKKTHPLFCTATDRKTSPNIEKLSLYSDGRYNAEYNLATYPDSVEEVEKEISQSPSPPSPAGLYQSGRYYYWIAKGNKWNTPDGSPFAMSCFDSQMKLYCKTTYRLKNQVFVNYGFLIRKEKATEDAKEVFDLAQSFIHDLLDSNEKK